MMRVAMDLDEFKLVLEVTQRVWMGSWLCPMPKIKFYCTNKDRKDEICLMASPPKKFNLLRDFSQRTARTRWGG